VLLQLGVTGEALGQLAKLLEVTTDLVKDNISLRLLSCGFFDTVKMFETSNE
jgi:hypothetical protein